MTKRIALHVLTGTLILAASACELDAGPPIPPAYTAERRSIADAADRLLLLQNANGSWDWDVTGRNGPTEITYQNIAGVTGEGLLDAYESTGAVKYLEAARKTGDYLIAQIGNPVVITKKSNSSCVLFLYHLNAAGGGAQFKTEADAIMNNLLYEDNYWAHYNGNHALDDGVHGCSALELAKAVQNYRGVELTISGIVVWDLFGYVEAALAFGDSVFADELAELGGQYVAQAGYLPTAPCYLLGMSGAVIGMKKAGLDVTGVLNALAAAQKPDGSWEDDNGLIQTTAYAIQAMAAGGKNEAAHHGVRFALARQGMFDGWLEIDGKEYSEVDSEMIQAISDSIGD